MNKKEKNKRAMTQLKAVFLIVNMIIAIVAFSWMISAAFTLDGTTNFIKSAPKGSETTASTSALAEKTTSTLTKTAGGASGVSKISTFTDGATWSLKSGTTAQSVAGVVPVGTSEAVTLNKISSAKVLSDGTYEITSASGKTIVSAKDGAEIVSQTGLQGANTAAQGGVGWTNAATGWFGQNIMSNLINAGMIGGLGYIVGNFLGGNGGLSGFLAGFGGTVAYQVATAAVGKGGAVFGQSWLTPGIFGIAVGAGIFLFMYKKESQEVVEFNCLPWQPPIGGEDCEKCNDFEECTEYSCKSLGQACQLLNAGTGEESCDWVNPHDVNSPKINLTDVLKGYKWAPDTTVRPPATGATISQENGDCVKAFTALEFTITADEPAQCKIDYNLTTGFDEMAYYMGGSNLFSYNHTEKMSLPSPDAINAVDPEIKNDGTYTLYVRCRDANGNFNQDAYSVRFCVEKGPDTTPPKIEGLSIPSNSPVSYNTTNLSLEVYVNEPAECKWSREDRDFKQMENNMSCATKLWQINNNNVYTCKTTLTGIKNEQDNEFYFRCKDQPDAEESERNVNVQSSLYNVIGTRALNILSIKPSNETIKDSTDTVVVNLEVKTDNGYKDGESSCYYTTTKTTDTSVSDKTCIGDEDSFLVFADTGNISVHSQRQDLVTGDYTYYVKCVDLGGNAVYNCTEFDVEVDVTAPIVVRAYKESGQLKVVTNEEATCSYSNKDCNFEIKDGVQMSDLGNNAYSTEWLITKTYYIRCSDNYNTSPNSNTCSVVVRPYKLVDKTNVNVL